jgi:hypothetical protein
MVGTADNRTDLLYDHAISLGGSCQPAWHLRKNRLRRVSYPLDWINSRNSTEALCTVLRTRFADFFEKAYFQPTDIVNRKNERAFQHSKNGFMFWHEFKSLSGFEEHFEERRDLYQRRIKRMLDVLDSDATVLFARFRTSREDAGQLAETLHDEFPRMRFSILALDDTDEIREDWGMPRVVNRYIECAPNHDATNPDYDQHWTNAFNEFSIAAKDSRWRRRWRRWGRRVRKPVSMFLD